MLKHPLEQGSPPCAACYQAVACWPSGSRNGWHHMGARGPFRVRVGTSSPFAHACRHEHRPRYHGCACPTCACAQVLVLLLCTYLFVLAHMHISLLFPFPPGCQPRKFGELCTRRYLAKGSPSE